MFDFLLNLIQAPGYLDEKKRGELLEALSKKTAAPSSLTASKSSETEADLESTAEKGDAKESSDDTA